MWDTQEYMSPFCGDYRDLPTHVILSTGNGEATINDFLIFRCPVCNTVFIGSAFLLKGECSYCLADWESDMGEYNHDKSLS